MFGVMRRALIPSARFEKVNHVKQRIHVGRSVSSVGRFLAFLLMVFVWVSAHCEPQGAAVSTFNAYAGKVELRLREQHRRADGFLVLNFQTNARLRNGELIIEQLSRGSEAELPGALLHHWRGTAFVPDATAADFERLMKNFDSYPRTFAPQVMQVRIPTQDKDGPDRFLVRMRIRQRRVITVVMDATYDIRYGRLDAQHGYSISQSTKIVEIDSPSTAQEHALSQSEEHGFLWRMNTYWSYEEREGGLYMQVESISLTRSIPVGLGWAVRPYVESVPRESLEFTLRAASSALKK